MEKQVCVSTLEALVGVPINSIEPLFKEADANGDGVLIKNEVMKKYGGMADMRSGCPSGFYKLNGFCYKE